MTVPHSRPFAPDDDLTKDADGSWHFTECSRIFYAQDVGGECDCDTARAAYLRGLVELAEFLYVNPDVSPPVYGRVIPFGLHVADGRVDSAPVVAGAIGGMETVEPTNVRDGKLEVCGTLTGGLRVRVTVPASCVGTEIHPATAPRYSLDARVSRALTAKGANRDD